MKRLLSRFPYTPEPFTWAGLRERALDSSGITPRGTLSLSTPVPKDDLMTDDFTAEDHEFVDLANNWAKWDQAHPKGTKDQNRNGGIRGKRARRAIIGFQKRRGLAVTGKLDGATKALAAKVAASGDPAAHRRANALNALANGNRREAGKIIARRDAAHRASKKAKAVSVLHRKGH